MNKKIDNKLKKLMFYFKTILFRNLEIFLEIALKI